MAAPARQPCAAPSRPVSPPHPAVQAAPHGPPLFQSLSVHQYAFNPCRQPLRRRSGLRRHPGGILLSQRLGIGALMIVDRARQGNKNRRPPDHGDLRHRRSPGPGDHQMRTLQPRLDIGEERREFGLDPSLGENGPRLVLFLQAALLHHMQPRPQIRRQQGQGSRDQRAENFRARASRPGPAIQSAAPAARTPERAAPRSPAAPGCQAIPSQCPQARLVFAKNQESGNRRSAPQPVGRPSTAFCSCSTSIGRRAKAAPRARAAPPDNRQTPPPPPGAMAA